MAAPAVNGTACKSSLYTPCKKTQTNDEMPEHVVVILACGGIFFVMLVFLICFLKSRKKCKSDDTETRTRNQSPVCQIREDGTMIVDGEVIPLEALPPSYSSLNFSDPYIRNAVQRRISVVAEMPPSYSSLDLKELIAENMDQIADEINDIVENSEAENAANNTTEIPSINTAENAANNTTEIPSINTAENAANNTTEIPSINTAENGTNSTENTTTNTENVTIIPGSNVSESITANKENVTSRVIVPSSQPGDTCRISVENEVASDVVSSSVASPTTSSKEVAALFKSNESGDNRRITIEPEVARVATNNTVSPTDTPSEKAKGVFQSNERGDSHFIPVEPQSPTSSRVSLADDTVQEAGVLVAHDALNKTVTAKDVPSKQSEVIAKSNQPGNSCLINVENEVVSTVLASKDNTDRQTTRNDYVETDVKSTILNRTALPLGSLTLTGIRTKSMFNY